MINKLLNNRKIILGSQSPRRSQLLKELDIEFEKRVIEIDETFDSKMDVTSVAQHIAVNKAKAHRNTLNPNEIVITADCVVVANGNILGKPKDEAQAIKYLNTMSDSTHEVISGVCIMDLDKMVSFSETAIVKMRAISRQEIQYYLNKYKPFDKAGAYGIQEWIGHSQIEWIKGTYTCIMGLPTRQLYEALEDFLN